MRRFLHLLLVLASAATFNVASAQTVVSNESYPNTFNTGFTAPPINTTFTGSIGTWSAFSTDANSTIVVNNAHFQSSPCALKIVNYNTSGDITSTCRATSPTVNLSALGCVNTTFFNFKLYTYNLSSANANFTFSVEFSNDNGTNFTSVWSATAQQIVNIYGTATWSDVAISIPSIYKVSGFKYRFKGVQLANTNYDSYLYIDDIKVLTSPCIQTCSAGTFNPTDAAEGFNVMTKNSFFSQQGHTDASVAVGGDMYLQGTSNLGLLHTGYYPYGNNDADNYGLVVNGRMYYTSGNQTTVNNGYFRLGNSTGSRLFYRDCNSNATNLKVTPYNATCATAFNAMPQLSLQRQQASGTASESSYLEFTSAFLTFQDKADVMATYSATSTCASSLNIITPGTGNINVTLNTSKVNVMNITSSQLNAITGITFTNRPTVTAPLVINVSGTSSFTWTPFNAGGLQNSDGAFIIFNFYQNTGTITLSGNGNTVFGTIFAPDASFVKSHPGNTEGQIVALNFTLNGGEVHYQRFAACLPDCSSGTSLNLGNLVWKDLDNDGLQDAGEPGIAGVTVKLYLDADNNNTPDGAAIATTTTNASGIYSFTGLSANEYIVGVVIPSGYLLAATTTTSLTPDNNDLDDNNGINYVSGEIRTKYITLSVNGEPSTDGDGSNGNLSLDIALYQIQTGNCTSTTASTPGGHSVTFTGVTYTGTAPNIKTKFTYQVTSGNSPSISHFTFGDFDCISCFDGSSDIFAVTGGTYSMGTDPTTGMCGLKFDFGINGGQTATVSFTLNGYYDVGTILFVAKAGGNVEVVPICGPTPSCTPPSNLSLGNFVWNDINNDGNFDTGEPPVSGVTVRLYNDTNGDNIADGSAIATTTTNASGNYLFSNLQPGNYIVGIVIPSGYTAGTVAVSNNPNNDINNDNNGLNIIGSNVAGSEVRSNFITLSDNGEPINDGDTNNDSNLTLDFALKGTGSIGDYVWNDVDEDGIQDTNEFGIANVTVTITYPGGSTATTTTNASGNYLFSNLGPGTYSVCFTAPAGMTATLANQLTDDTKDSDPVSGCITNIVLTAGENDLTNDAGYYLNPCIAPQGTCGAGFLLKQKPFVLNGNFTSAITSPASGNSWTGTCATTGITYNFSGGNFKAQAEYDGTNVRPSSNDAFSIITSASAFVPGSGNVNQMPFPGDATYLVPSTNSWLYHRGNSLACERLLWEQTFSGLFIGKTYTFRLYASNAVQGADFTDPILRIETGGTTGLPNGTVVAGPTTLTEAATENADALNGWVRISYTFTATAPTMMFKITDAQTSTSGDEVAITAIGIEACERDTDGDCVADVDDIDDDNDGILDIVESGGCDPLLDTDGDGIPNYKDSNSPGCLPWSDCNTDGINDAYDFDRDGIINELDLDSDNDGIVDHDETRSASAVDNNNDGMADGIDNDDDGLMSTADANDNVVGGPGLTPQDLDRDGTPNYLDLDSDGDGITDLTEALETYDADGIIASGITSPVDGDLDGVRGNVYNNATTTADNFNGFGARGINPLDRDNDGKPNPYDIDSDNDGISDNIEGQPTCSFKLPTTADCDGDGVADPYDVGGCNVCIRTSGGITPYDKDSDGTPDIYDLDTDNDGAPDVNEGAHIFGNFVTNFNDTDGDGLIDQFDVFNILTATSNFINNVGHNQFGPNGNFNGPVPTGSNSFVWISKTGTTCTQYDRDWREVTTLPVSIISFTGNVNGSAAKLNWTVANESNMDKYEVEKSHDGNSFIKAAEVVSVNSAANYTYSQNDVVNWSLGTTVYYRLKQIEKGGSFKYSNVLVFRSAKQKNAIAVHPNPATNYFLVKIEAQKDAQAQIRVMDIVGKQVMIQSEKVLKGLNTISFNNISHLSAGTYTVQVLMGDEIHNQRLLIIR